MISSELISRTDSPMFIVVMGVSGSGKSTLGKALADSLHMPFVDGDDLHPPQNVDKMSRGVPLTDEDRAPWLALIRTTAEHMAVEQQSEHLTEPHHAQGRRGVVIACSALKRAYRNVLRGDTERSSLPDPLQPPHPDILPTYFVFIDGSREVLLDRMGHRQGHFMKVGMLDSQLAALESPVDEPKTAVVFLQDSTEAQVASALHELDMFL